jgi:hypothetical protein
MPHKCPECGLFSPNGTSRCDCRFDFEHGHLGRRSSSVNRVAEDTEYRFASGSFTHSVWSMPKISAAV